MDDDITVKGTTALHDEPTHPPSIADATAPRARTEPTTSSRL